MPASAAQTASAVRLTWSDELAPRWQADIAGLMAHLQALVPRAEIHHVGSTAIPGALTKGDVDLLLRVGAGDFPAAVATLRRHFAVKQAGNWTEAFASFGDDTSFPFPLGVQLAVRDSEGDVFLRLHERIATDARLLAEYNRLKRDHAPRGPKEYWEAKDRFFARLVSGRSQA